MKRVQVLFGIVLAFTLLVSIPAAYSQVTAPAEKLQADKTMSGALVKVDTTAKLITVKGPDEKEMAFNYNDDTQVISPDKTVQGLTGKAGAELKISYREERGANLATKIELVEKAEKQ
jgi:hypothetical protein